MRAGKAVFQRNRERTFVGFELPIFFLEWRILVTVEFAEGTTQITADDVVICGVTF